MLIIKFNILFLAFLLKTLQIHSLSIPIISDLQDILSLASDINDIASRSSPIETLFMPKPNPLNIAIGKINDIAEHIESFKDTIDGQFDNAVRTVLSRIPREDKLNRRIEQFHEQIVTIDRLFEDLIFYSNDSDYFQPIVMEDFVNAATSMQYGAIPHVLNLLRDAVIERMPIYFHQGLLSLLLQKEVETTTVDDRCDESQSFQHRVFEIYSIVVLTELRAHAATTFAYRFIAEHYNVSVEVDVRRSESRLVLRAAEYMLEIRDVLRNFFREIYRCDPPNHIRDETYYELNGTFTSIFVGMSQANFDHKLCDLSCESISPTSGPPCGDKGSGYCGVHVCRGAVHSCFTIPGNSIDICENPEGSTKFFSDAKDDGSYFGDGINGKCPYTTFVMNYREARNFYHYTCDNCICKCDQTGPGVPGMRTVNLRPQMALIENNMAVTNVRFLVKDGLIHIQIEHAPLLPYGEIMANRKEWISVGNYRHEANEEKETFYLIDNDNEIELKEREDYVFIEQSQRFLNLDDIVSPNGYLVTGVRFNFKHSEDSQSTPLQLELYVTPWDIHTGKFIPTEEKPSFWLDADSQPYKAYAYGAVRSIIGSEENYVYNVEQEIKHDINLETNKQIKFQQSHLKSDVGQTTVPFLDARPALIKSRTIYGLGLIWRGNKKYAGFVAFKVFGLNDVEFLRPFFSSSQYNYYHDLNPVKLKRKPLVDDSEAAEGRKK